MLLLEPTQFSPLALELLVLPLLLLLLVQELLLLASAPVLPLLVLQAF